MTGAAGAEDGHLLDSRDAGGRFLRGSGIRVAALGAGLAAGLISTPLAVHHLGPSRWGEYAAVTALIFVVAAITEGGLGQLGVRELSIGDRDARGRFVRELLGLRITLTIIGALGALAFSAAVGYPAVMVAGTAMAGVGMLLTNVAGTLGLPLAAELRLGWMALLDFLPSLATAVTMIALVAAGASLLPFYAASIVAGACTLVAAALVVRRLVPIAPTFNVRRWRPLLASTVVYAAATATGAIYFRVVLLATSLLSTKAETGYFGLAFRVLELAALVPWLIVSSAFPILVRSAWNDRARLAYALQRLQEGSLILGGWMALCLIIGAPFIIHVLALGSPRFRAAVPVLRILGAAIPATFLIATYSYALLSLQRYRPLLIANGAIILIAVALCGGFIPEFGAEGAAAVSLTIELLLMGAYAFFLFSGHPELRPGGSTAARVLLSLLLGFGAGVLLLSHPVLGVLAGTAVLCASLFALRAVPRELLDAIRR